MAMSHSVGSNPTRAAIAILREIKIKIMTRRDYEYLQRYARILQDELESIAKALKSTVIRDMDGCKHYVTICLN